MLAGAAEAMAPFTALQDGVEAGTRPGRESKLYPLTRAWSSLGSRTVALLAVALVLLVAVAGLSYRSARAARAGAASVESTQAILQQAQLVLTLSTDAETGQRGFLLTSDPSYLQPYDRAVVALASAVQRLDDLTSAGGLHRDRVRELQFAIEQKLAELKATIVAADSIGVPAAVRIVRTGEGRALMERIRGSVGAIADGESRRLAEQEAVLTRSTREASYMTVVALGLAAVATGGATAVMMRGVRRRERARAALAEDAIREEAARRMAAIVESSDDVILAKDLDGVITSWNPAAERTFGYRAHEAIGQPITIIVPPDRLFEEGEVLRRMRAGERTDHFDTVRWTKDGRPVEISLSVSPIRDRDGAIIGASTIARDITERKRAEADLKRLNETLEERVHERTRQLEEINVELNAFGYTVSHDLRAPLRAMNGFATALVSAYGDKLDARGKDFAGRIVAAAEQMDRLIQDLLAYSRLSRDELRLQPLTLDDVVRDTLAALAAEIQQRRASVSVSESLGVVVANRQALGHVVTNLLSNAIKFVAPAATPRVRVWSEPTGGMQRLWVADNGIGIEPAYQANIFRVFERLHASEAYPGTGIGLAIVRRGTERMGGRVGLESTPGQGTAFWIELPRGRAADDGS